jgi:hypothetical protein
MTICGKIPTLCDVLTRLSAKHVMEGYIIMFLKSVKISRCKVENLMQADKKINIRLTYCRDFFYHHVFLTAVFNSILHYKLHDFADASCAMTSVRLIYKMSDDLLES